MPRPLLPDIMGWQGRPPASPAGSEVMYPRLMMNHRHMATRNTEPSKTLPLPGGGGGPNLTTVRPIPLGYAAGFSGAQQ